MRFAFSWLSRSRTGALLGSSEVEADESEVELPLA